MRASLRPLCLPVLCAAILAALGCGADETSLGTTATTTTSTSSATGGAGGAAAPSFPAPAVAGTPETDALAASPARCGQAAHAWLKDAGLGHVSAHAFKASYTASLLTTLASGAGITLPVTLKYDVSTYLVTYATQDRGVKLDATTLVAWPQGLPAGAAPLPTLLVLHGTSGFTDGCGPTKDAETALLAAALASVGFIVVAPDYIGLKATPPPTGFLHPYLVGQATAIASLDAVRSLRELAPLLDAEGLAAPSPKVAVIGGSQGGHAALWVDRLAPYYARELELVGTAATVPPADMVGEANLALTMVRPSSGNMAAFLGASAGWYGAGGDLSEVFVSPFAEEIQTALGASCDPSGAVDDIASLEQVFQPPLLDAAANGTLASISPWGCMIAENGLLTTDITRIQQDPASYGVLFITGEADQLVDTPTERAAFPVLCEAGLPSRYIECAGASHTKATAWALPEIVSFLMDRVEGKAFVSSCDTKAAVTCAGTPTP